MPTLKTRAKNLYEWVSHRTTQVSAYIPIEEAHIEHGIHEEDSISAFIADQHYFRAVISEMFLANSREWFTEYNPIVFSAIEFNYGRFQQEEPKIVGPDLLGQGRPAPAQGTLYLDTPVSGFHPYRGGDFTFTVILYRAKRSNHLLNLLTIMEKVVNAVDPSVAFASYMGIANVIVDGLELILGTHQTDPIIGVRKTFGVAQSGKFRPGFYALINADDSTVKGETLWVRDNRLYVGDTLKTSVPYRNHDFVLFKIVQSAQRDDINLLPFYPVWEEAQKQAIEPKSWEDAKSTFATLYRELIVSPDLTGSQKEKLRKEYMSRLKELRKRALDQQHMGESRGVQPEVKSEMHSKLDELENLFQELN